MSDAKRIRDYQKSRQPKPPISKAAHRANCEDIVDDLLMPIITKMLKSPSDIQPVSDSFEDLLSEMHGVKRQPFIMQAGLRRLAVCDDEVIELEYQPSNEKPADDTKKATLFDTGNDTEIVTKFSSEELELLKQIQENG
jgi:hypothetical protein